MKNAVYILMIIFNITVIAQQRGNLAGRVTDAGTGEALPGVNIILKGTYYGAASDVNGNFRINNISSGEYTVEVSLIGYKTTQYTGLKISANKTLQLDVELEETVLTLEQDVVVVGEKPLLDVEETQSKKTISKDEIEVAVDRNKTDCIFR